MWAYVNQHTFQSVNPPHGQLASKPFLQNDCCTLLWSLLFLCVVLTWYIDTRPLPVIWMASFGNWLFVSIQSAFRSAWKFSWKFLFCVFDRLTGSDHWWSRNGPGGNKKNNKRPFFRRKYISKGFPVEKINSFSIFSSSPPRSLMVNPLYQLCPSESLIFTFLTLVTLIYHLDLQSREMWWFLMCVPNFRFVGPTVQPAECKQTHRLMDTTKNITSSTNRGGG